MKLPDPPDGAVGKWLRALLWIGLLLWMARMHRGLARIEAEHFTGIDAEITTQRILNAVEDLRETVIARLDAHDGR